MDKYYIEGFNLVGRIMGMNYYKFINIIYLSKIKLYFLLVNKLKVSF